MFGKLIYLVALLVFLLSLRSAFAYNENYISALEATEKPKIFFPNIVSIRDTIHYNSSFSDDGKTIVYTRKDANNRSMASYQQYINGTFSVPIPISSDQRFSYGDPHISADGKTVILSSDRPVNIEHHEPKTHSLWLYNQTNTGWGQPKEVVLKMDYEGGFGYPSLTANGNLYFQYFSAVDRNMDIFSAKLEQGRYSKPVKLPAHISGEEFEGDPFIDRKERFIIFAGFNRKENYGLSDLYISFKQGEKWSKAVNLGREINSHGFDGSPYVTPNDEYLIFTSSRHPDKEHEQEKFNVFYVNFDLSKYKTLAVGG